MAAFRNLAVHSADRQELAHKHLRRAANKVVFVQKRGMTNMHGESHELWRVCRPTTNTVKGVILRKVESVEEDVRTVDSSVDVKFPKVFNHDSK